MKQRMSPTLDRELQCSYTIVVDESDDEPMDSFMCCFFS